MVGGNGETGGSLIVGGLADADEKQTGASLAYQSTQTKENPSFVLRDNFDCHRNNYEYD